MTLERGSTAGFGLDGVAILRRNRVDAEVPYAEIDHLVRDHLHQGKLAEVKRLFGSDLEPVSAREKLGGGLDYIFLALAGAKQRDAEAVDDADARPDIGANDDVTALGRTALGVILHRAGGAVSVDGERRSGGISHGLIADADIEDGIFDVELDGRLLAFELDDLMRGGERIDRSLQEIVSCVAIQVAVGLGEGNEFGRAVIGVEDEGAVSFGKAKVFRNLRRQGGAVGFFLEEFGVDGGSVRVGIVGIVGIGFRVLALPTLSGFDIHERKRDLLFGSAALGADVMDDVADDLCSS